MEVNKETERAWWMRVENALESVFKAEIDDWQRLWHSLLHHCRHWPLPARWSAADWAREIEDEAVLAALLAREAFDRQWGVAWPVFLYWQVRQALLALYRREYRFGRDCPGELPRDVLSMADAGDAETEDQLCVLSAARTQLAPGDQELLHRLYEEEETEASVATQRRISQQSISKRKQKVLNALRRILEGLSK